MIKEKAIALNNRWIRETQMVVAGHQTKIDVLNGRIKEYRGRIAELDKGETVRIEREKRN